jgi:sugar porter (SP) family MFS transporter
MNIDNSIKSSEKSGSAVYVLLVCLVAAVGGLLFGFDTAVIAGANPFLKAHFELTDGMQGFVVASAILGCIPGAIFAGMMSDRFGRKKILLLCAVFFAASAVWSGLAGTLPEFVIARFLGGIGVGAASMLSPMYIAEISPAIIRGRLVSLNQLAIVTGILVAYFTDYFLVGIPETNWRWMFGSETLPAVIFFALLLTVPESPRWLAKQQRQDEALEILTKVGGKKHAEIEFAEIKNSIEHEEATIAQLFHPGMRVALIIGIAMAVLQQITGINIIMYYAPTIFQAAGSAIDASIIQAVAVGGMNLVATLVAIYMVDKFGRKILLLVGSAGMAVFLLLVGLALQGESQNAYLVVIFVVCYVGFFAVSLGPVVWVVISEIFPTKVRGRAMAIATVFLWTTNAVVTQIFPLMLDCLAPIITFGFFAAMSVITFIFVMLVVPETKGKTLEEIEKLWAR